jgi:hypothetical protein
MVIFTLGFIVFIVALYGAVLATVRLCDYLHESG